MVERTQTHVHAGGDVAAAVYAIGADYVVGDGCSDVYDQDVAIGFA